MNDKIALLDYFEGKEAAALLIDGKLYDFFAEEDARAPGSIFRVKVKRQLRGNGGIFVESPDGDFFLHQTKGINTGDIILVQVSSYGDREKLPRVTTKILFKSRYVIVTPFAVGLNIAKNIQDDERRIWLKQMVTEGLEEIPYGMILRSSCISVSDSEILNDCRNILTTAQNILSDDNNKLGLVSRSHSPHQMAWREWSDIPVVDENSGSFAEYGVLELIDELKNSKVIINDCNYYIEPTQAFVAVDVNTAADISFAAGLKANLAMAKDLPRQLRLRGLGGQIVIDPAPIPKRDRRALENALRAAFRKDTVETNFVGWTAMGLLELQRARIRPNWLNL